MVETVKIVDLFRNQSGVAFREERNLAHGMCSVSLDLNNWHRMKYLTGLFLLACFGILSHRT